MFEHFERDARLIMRACVVRGILLDRIFNHQTITYQEMAGIVKTIPGGGELSQALSMITADDAAKRQPLSVAAVVNSRTGTPGQGFFNQCRKLGLLAEKKPTVLASEPQGEVEFDHLVGQALDLRTNRHPEPLPEPLSEEERIFWLQQVQDLDLDVSVYWDHEVQQQLGHGSEPEGELPPNLWDNGLDAHDPIPTTAGPPLEAPAFRINGKAAPPPTFRPLQPRRNPRDVLTDSKQIYIPALLLRKGDTVLFNNDTKVVQWVGLDPPSAAQGVPKGFVHWISTCGQRYRENPMGNIKVLTPPNILQRLDPREPGLPIITPLDASDS